MKLKTIKIPTIASALVFSQPFVYNAAYASPVHFTDNGMFTTDTLSGLDWLDVTESVNRSYNDVSGQFGLNGDYVGWRYATGDEFNQMISNYTDVGIAPGNYNQTNLSEGVIDNLHFLLGSTLDTQYNNLHGTTYDNFNGFAEGDVYDFTQGLIDSAPNNANTAKIAIIVDDDRDISSIDFIQANHNTSDIFNGTDNAGSFLVRNTLAPVPVPAAAWLMGSGLLGLMGFSRKRSQISQVFV